ncbi:hypothetical protein WME75_41970 [Sorangium sp. So ce1014]|uniref:hypothetical protein n=1 Tax=Sorangium sp. So ce1014 TaxID=3133326 RepID=UPI003F6089B3
MIKDVLYFLAPGSPVLVRMFPPPMYEVPDNALFEITGVLQVLPAWIAAAALARRVLGRRPAPPGVVDGSVDYRTGSMR